MMSELYVVYSTPNGVIGEEHRLRPVDYTGTPLQLDELIPLPDGATLAMLPQRLATGLTPTGECRSVSARRGWALAALLPIGYTRTRLPGYRKLENAVPLPFFGYTAVAGYRGRLYVAALATDSPHKWLPRHYNRRQLERLVRQRLAAEPDNRLLAHHAHCALDYSCPTASNIFFRRWEAAIAVSPGCNARCIGCISKQDADNLVSPQDRLRFIPSVDEIVAIAVPHLESAPDAILSFGQGCEGEPLLQWHRIAEAIRAIRARTWRGTININTNASNPRALQRLYNAGLDSLRASTISARPEVYNAYYRPLGYGLAQVRESLERARDAGVYSSINLLTLPGLTDTEEEVAAWLEFLHATSVRLVQIRNLNIDPDLLLPKLPPPGRPMGIPAFLDTLRRELPNLRIGNFSLPIGNIHTFAGA
jgi:pyruvate-formate lyase-activating enzyme